MIVCALDLSLGLHGVRLRLRLRDAPTSKQPKIFTTRTAVGITINRHTALVSVTKSRIARDQAVANGHHPVGGASGLSVGLLISGSSSPFFCYLFPVAFSLSSHILLIPSLFAGLLGRLQLMVSTLFSHPLFRWADSLPGVHFPSPSPLLALPLKVATMSSTDLQTMPAELPAEVLKFVLEHVGAIDPHALIFVVPMVCRKWRDVCLSQIDGVDIKISTRRLKKVYEHDSSPVADVKAIIRRVRSVRAFGLKLSPSTPDEELAAVVSGFRLSLTSLNLSGCWNICGPGIDAVADVCPNLTSLNMYGCDQVKEMYRIATVAASNPNLTHLAVGRRMTDDGLRMLAESCLNLTFFHLRDNERVTDVGIQKVVAGCPNLASLKLSVCANVSFKGLFTAACPRLTSLTLNGCGNVTDAGIQRVAAFCPNLTSIDLTGCECVTDTGIEKVAAGCPNLRNLDIFGCWRIKSDEALKKLAAGCPNLRQVVLAGGINPNLHNGQGKQ